MKHELKIHPQHYQRVKQGIKTFEIRENDRAFQMGDEVSLREYDPTIIHKRIDSTPMGDDYADVPSGYTGEYLDFKIGSVYPIDDKRVVFSLLPTDTSGGSDD